MAHNVLIIGKNAIRDIAAGVKINNHKIMQNVVKMGIVKLQLKSEN